MTDAPPPPAHPYGDDPKAHAKAAKAYANAQRPWYKKKRFIIPIVLVALIVIGSAASGGGDDDTTKVAAGGNGGPETQSNNDANPPPADVDDGWSCDTNDIGWAQVTGRVTNHSSESSSYLITVVFTSGGQRFADATGFVNSVRSGESAPFEAVSTEEPPGKFDCEITEVERHAF